MKFHNPEFFEFNTAYFLPWKNQLVEEIENAGSIVKCFNRTNNYQIINSLGLVSEYLKKNKIEMIHAHLPWAGLLARRVGKYAGVPVIYTEHNKQERYHFITRYLNLNSLHLNTQTIAVSDEVAKSIRKYTGKDFPIVTINNGIDTGKFNPEGFEKNSVRNQYNIPDGSLVIGNVAVFRVQKRLDLWIKISHEILKIHPDTYFILVGDGPLKNKINKMVLKMSLQDRIILPGIHDDVRPFYAAMDILMITSKFEGLPLALLEAMSMKLPVAATAAGGIGEVIRDGIDGFTVPVEQPFDLIEKINLLKDNNRQEMGVKARERIISGFSVKNMASKLEDLYRSTYDQYSKSRRQ